MLTALEVVAALSAAGVLVWRVRAASWWAVVLASFVGAALIGLLEPGLSDVASTFGRAIGVGIAVGLPVGIVLAIARGLTARKKSTT